MAVKENDVKKLVKDWLKEIDAWHVMVVPGGFGRGGIPDFLCLSNGVFFAIETKRPGRRGEKNEGVSALQSEEMNSIRISGGGAFKVDDEDSLNTVKQWLSIQENIMSKRMIYDINADDAKVIARLGESEGVNLVMNAALNPVAKQLALMGLVKYLQQATNGIKEEDKLEAVEHAYEELKERGMGVFERKAPAPRPRGPKKVDKIAALAALLNTTPTIIKEKLSEKSEKKQEEILNSERVLNKVAEMQRAENIEL